MAEVTIRRLEEGDIEGAVALQSACFPPPFPSDLLWQPHHLRRHMELFPEGQFAASDREGRIVGSASSLLVSEEAWLSHGSWDDITGGLSLENHNPLGTILYCADISVHPDFRRLGIGRRLYHARFDLVRRLGLQACAASCRLPDFQTSGCASPDEYVKDVAEGRRADRTLSPLLKLGMNLIGVSHGAMDDPESGNAAGLLEWRP